MLIRLILITILCNFSNLYAQVVMEPYTQCQSTTAKTIIVHTNGILTDRQDAYLNLTLIKTISIPRENDIDPKGVSYKLAHNWSHGFFMDILESLAQKIPQKVIETLQLLDQYHAFAKLVLTPTTKVYDLLTPDFQKDILKIAKSYVTSFTTKVVENKAQVTSNLITCYKSILDADKRIYAIPHSQGGLFVNDAFNTVFPDHTVSKGKFATYQIGTAANKINDICWEHGKNRLDILSELNIGEPYNLPLSPIPQSWDLLFHSLTDTYLNPAYDDLSRSIIDGIASSSPVQCAPEQCEDEDERPYLATENSPDDKIINIQGIEYECKTPGNSRTLFPLKTFGPNESIDQYSPLPSEWNSPLITYLGCYFDGHESSSVLQYSLPPSYTAEEGSQGLMHYMFCAEENIPLSQNDAGLTILGVIGEAYSLSKKYFSINSKASNCYNYKSFLVGLLDAPHFYKASRLINLPLLPHENCSNCPAGQFKINGTCTCPDGMTKDSTNKCVNNLACPNGPILAFEGHPNAPCFVNLKL